MLKRLLEVLREWRAQRTLADEERRRVERLHANLDMLEARYLSRGRR